ncbi:MAG: radical SAM protein, partial [Elusimicrobiota bacterium]
MLTESFKRVYWETTAGCNLRCIHCRRLDVLTKQSSEELSLSQAKSLIDDLAAMGKPVLILSGGEPLFRKDIFEISSYAKARGLGVGISTNGTLVNEEIARHLKDSGIHYGSISLDGAKAATHDIFRGKGNFDRAVRGAKHLMQAGIKVQVNFTVTKQNVQELAQMYEMARSLGAYALYLFLLVPVGCGVKLADSQMLDAQEVETWLKWAHQKDKEGPLHIKTICAPHYYRIESEAGRRGGEPSQDSRKGCLAGVHMCFISHKGDVFPCGYLPVSCGNIKETPLRKIWENSPVFKNLRDPDLLEGRCGACSYKLVCGGC